MVNIHNVELAKRYCHRMIGMTGGKVVFDGPPSDLTEANLKEIYGARIGCTESAATSTSGSRFAPAGLVKLSTGAPLMPFLPKRRAE